MDPRNNRRDGSPCRSPQHRPTPLLTSRPQAIETDPQNLRAVQQENRRLVAELNNFSWEKNIWVKHREAFCCQMVKLKDLNSRLKGRLELKDEEIAAERRKNP